MIRTRSPTSLILSVLLGLSVVFIAAGGVGLAASVGLKGLLLMPLAFVPAWRGFKTAPTVIFLSALTLSWFAISSAWSPYEHADQAYKTLILTPLFACFAYLGCRLSDLEANHQARVLTVLMMCAGAYLAVEALSGGMIGAWVELELEESTVPAEAVIHAKITLSRGATPFMMVAGPIAIWLWRGQGTLRQGMALGLALICAISAAGFDVEANVLALVMGVGMGALALWAPRSTLQTLLTGSAIWVMGAPIFMGALLALTPQSVIDALPLSWASRLEIWRAVIDQLQNAPIFGHGLDAMRTMDQDMVIQGAVIDVLPPHAHNFGLHIWMDTGAVGAFLTAMVLLTLGRAARRASVVSDQLMGLTYVCTIWLVSVMIGYGVWQEWHHAALALGCFTAFLNRTGRTL